MQIIEPPKPPPYEILPESVSVNDLIFTDTLTGWLSVSMFTKNRRYGGGIYKSVDGGKEWFLNFVSEKSPLKDIRVLDKNRMWVPGNKGVLLFTSDGGSSWQSYDTKKFLGEEDTLFNFVRIFFLNNNEGWIAGSKSNSPINCGGYGYLFHTTNGGQDWNIDYTTTEAALTDIQILPDGSGWLAGGGHFLDCVPFISHKQNTDGIWVRQNLDDGVQGHAGRVRFLDRMFGFAYGPVGVLRTTNGGAKWELSEMGRSFTNTLYFANDSVIYISTGSPASIYKSVDKGIHWENQLVVATDLQQMFFLNDSTGWAAGTSGHLTRFEIYRYRNNTWSKIR